MKKKIALVITIAVCIVSVSANVYQYRVIQNKNASITWNQKVVDQMFQEELAYIGDQMIRLSKCESGEKDTEIGRTLGIAWMHSICIQAQVMEYLERNMMFIIWWLSLEIIWKIYSPMKHCGKMQRVVT